MLKYLLFSSLIFLLILPSCKRNKIIEYNQIRPVKIEDGLSALYMYSGRSEELPIDSTVYQGLIKRGKSEECAKRLAYAKTSMKLVRLTKKETDFSIYSYQRCRAFLEQDSIRISFGFPPFAGGNIAYFAGKPLELVIANQQFETTLTHTSDVSTSTKVNGKWVRTPFPTSNFFDTKLSLSQKKYSAGDTIRGNFHGQAYLKKKRQNTPTKEIIKGYFRVILEEEATKCE